MKLDKQFALSHNAAIEDGHSSEQDRASASAPAIGSIAVDAGTRLGRLHESFEGFSSYGIIFRVRHDINRMMETVC